MQAIQQIRNRRDWLSAALWDAAWLVVVAVVLSLIVRTAKADCVVVFSATWCTPCQQMRPAEEKLIGEGYDLRCVDIDQRPDLKRAYRIVRVPTVVYVAETATGTYELGRQSGLLTEDQLRWFCQPRRMLYNAQPVANAVRSILGLPILLY